MTDQLILSRDSPCSAVMPGTSVTLDCDPEHSYNPSSGEPVYIGVYGYAAAQFTLLVAPEGQSIELFPGTYRLCCGVCCVVLRTVFSIVRVMPFAVVLCIAVPFLSVSFSWQFAAVFVELTWYFIASYTNINNRPTSAVPHFSWLHLQHPISVHRCLQEQRCLQQEGGGGLLQLPHQRPR